METDQMDQERTQFDELNSEMSNDSMCDDSSGTGAFVDHQSPLSNDCDLSNDHHSSEEELEVINSASNQQRFTGSSGNSGTGVTTRSGVVRSMSAVPEKRKWCEMDMESASSAKELHQFAISSSVSTATIVSDTVETLDAQNGGATATGKCRMILRPHVRNLANPMMNSDAAATSITSKNDEDAVTGLISVDVGDDESMSNLCTLSRAFTPIVAMPPNFDKSPSFHNYKLTTHRSPSPTVSSLKAFNDELPPYPSFDCSDSREAATLPRKRHRITAGAVAQKTNHTQNIQRPCLDFEKMQQMKATGNSSITTWRNCGGDHSGELSLYCW